MIWHNVFSSKVYKIKYFSFNFFFFFKERKTKLSRRMVTNILIVGFSGWRENGCFKFSFACLNLSWYMWKDFCDKRFPTVLPKQNKIVKILLILMILKMLSGKIMVPNLPWTSSQPRQSDAVSGWIRTACLFPGPQSERMPCTLPSKAISHKPWRCS